MENKSAKYGLIGAIIAALISGIIALYIHFDTISKKEKMAAIEKQANKAKETANVTISDIFLPEINTKMKSPFFVKISNNSLNDAKNLNIKINFGEAEVFKCETEPINVFDENKTFESSIVSFHIQDLKREDYMYIYCLVSLPIFDSILITGSNLFQNEKYTYKQYKSYNGEASSGFINFFKIIGSIVVLIFVGYFTFLIIRLLNLKFNIE